MKSFYNFNIRIDFYYDEIKSIYNNKKIIES